MHGSIPAVGMAIAALALAPLAASAANYYVNGSSGSCSNSGPGSLAVPYCSISAALSANHSSGTTIVVLPGVYREQVTLPASGSPGSPIVLQAQSSPGNPVVVDSADDLGNPALWTLFSGDVWLAASVNWNPSQVFADEARLTASAVAPAALPANSFTYVAGAGLYANVGGGNPASHDVQASEWSFGFRVAGVSWVTIDGFTVSHSSFAGIEVSSSSNVDVTNNVATFSANYGIHAENSIFVLFGSNTCSDHLGSGIALTDGSNGCTVQDNESFRNVTPNQSNGIYAFGAPGNTIQRNRVHDNAYNGIFMATGANNSLVRQNLSWNNAHQGIEDIFCTGNVHIGDVSYGNAWNGFSIEGGATGTSLFNCVAVDNSRTAGNADLYVDANSTTGFTSSDNLFWNPIPSVAVVRYAGNPYTSVAAYQAATGNDARTLQADPKFADAASGDFGPIAGSPLIDSGNSGVPSWPVTDALGNPRLDDPATPNTGLGPIAFADRGALEYPPPGVSAVDGGAHDSGSQDLDLALRVIPNPANASASIAFRLERAARVEVRIYDLAGRLVRAPTQEYAGQPGWNSIALDGPSHETGPLRSGTYVVEIRAGGRRAVSRYVVIR